MTIQVVGAVIAAVWISPRTWIGTRSEVHVHVSAAIVLGGVISSLPIALASEAAGRDHHALRDRGRADAV
jgi:hypothetical protein